MTEDSIKKALKEADPSLDVQCTLTSFGYMIQYKQIEHVTTTVTICTLRELNDLYEELRNERKEP